MLKATAETTGLRVVVSASIENDASDVAQTARTLQEANPPAVLMFTIGRAAVSFVKAFRRERQGSRIFMLSPMGSHQTVQALGPDGAGIVVSQVVPFPFSPSTAIAREYQCLAGDSSNLSFIGMEGFMLAKVITEGLRRAGPHPTRERFVAAMEKLTTYDLGGYVIGFDKNQRRGPRYVELTAISQDGRFIR